MTRTSSRHATCCAALAAALLSAPALAQTPIAYKCHCYYTGTAPQEALGDREGHAMSVNAFTCRVEGGPLDGGVMTGSAIYEWDKTSAAGLSGNGVIRKPGTAAVYQHGEFKNSLTMADGKVTGFLASGAATYKLATGAAAPLAGRSFTYTARSAGPGQFTIDVKVE